LYAGIKQLSQVQVEADSFRPISSRWKHTLLGDSLTTYSDGKAEVKIKGKDGTTTTDIEGVLYDNEEALALMRRLPLATNYSTTIRVLAGLGGGNIIPLKLDVTGLETVKTAAGTFQCYKVELSIKQTFWYSADEHRYLVKFEAGGVVAELSEIRKRNSSEPTTYKDSMIALSAPSDWLFFSKQSGGGIIVLDPDGTADTQLSMIPLEKLTSEERKSLRTVAEKAAGEAKKHLKAFQIRNNSWKETTLGGQPALSVIADFKDGDNDHVAFAIFTMTNDTAVELHTHLPREDFESFRPKFERVAQTLKFN
jgi:hypothetical protein